MYAALSIRNGEVNVVKLLIEAGLDINAADSYGSTALIYAAWNDHADSVKLLVEEGADVNAASQSGWTALMYAASKGYVHIVEILIEAAANVNAVNQYGCTAWNYANGNTDVIDQLLQAGYLANDSLSCYNRQPIWSSSQPKKNVAGISKYAGPV